jgi:hypothetical protein
VNSTIMRRDYAAALIGAAIEASLPPPNDIDWPEVEHLPASSRAARLKMLAIVVSSPRAGA